MKNLKRLIKTFVLLAFSFASLQSCDEDTLKAILKGLEEIGADHNQIQQEGFTYVGFYKTEKLCSYACGNRGYQYYYYTNNKCYCK